MPIKPNSNEFENKVTELQKPGSKNININAVKGTGWNGTGWSITVTAHEYARGKNFSIPAHKTISFGAAADGMNIPKPKKSNKQQMTALVGEEGFEIAYIPSEQRSMILGANGPEVTSFPKDTIIYPHDISKDILRRGKQDHITAGSFETGFNRGELPHRSYSDTSSTKKNTSKAKKGKTGSGGDEYDVVHFTIQEVVRFNLDQKIKNLSEDIINRSVNKVLFSEESRALSENIKKFAAPDAKQKILEEIIKLVNKDILTLINEENV